MRIFVRWLVIFIALLLAARIVPGIAVEGTTSAWFAYAIMAVVLGLVNVFIKPSSSCSPAGALRSPSGCS